MILVTGATGFVGSTLVRRLAADRVFKSVVAVVRRIVESWPEEVQQVQIGDLLPTTDWSQVLQGVDVVVHCAARVHMMKEDARDSRDVYREVNVNGTRNLAKQSARAGIRRFVFLSSVNVNGELTEVGHPFTADDVPAPEDPYGVSKYEAEELLQKIAMETGMEVVIIRPPLVYGPGVKANFDLMMRWLARGLPLPLAAVTENHRSLVALDNLVDLIVICLNHPAAANQTFLVSDGEDLSTAHLLKRLGAAMGHPARMFYLSITVLKLGASVLNRPDIYQRLCGSLQLDITKTRQLLGWAPPVSVDEGLRRAVKGFRP